MTAKELISGAVISLRPGDIGSDALSLMDELRVSHLPVVNDLEFLGLISDSDIYNKGEYDQPAWDHKLTLNRVYVYEDQYIYDVIRLFSEQKLTLLPVLNAKNQYAGVITLADLVYHLATITSVDNPGGIIVIEVNEKDYLLTEIAGIVDSEGQSFRQRNPPAGGFVQSAQNFFYMPGFDVLQSPQQLIDGFPQQLALHGGSQCLKRSLIEDEIVALAANNGVPEF